MGLIEKLIMIVLLLLLTTNQVIVQGDTLESTTNMLLQTLQSTPMDAVLIWNLVTIQTIANDYDPDVTLSLEQGGGQLVSRALAMIHGAMYEAMVVFNQRFKPVFKVKNLP